jgi:hypothetical protein
VRAWNKPLSQPSAPPTPSGLCSHVHPGEWALASREALPRGQASQSPAHGGTAAPAARPRSSRPSSRVGSAGGVGRGRRECGRGWARAPAHGKERGGACIPGRAAPRRAWPRAWVCGQPLSPALKRGGISEWNIRGGISKGEYPKGNTKEVPKESGGHKARTLQQGDVQAGQSGGAGEDGWGGGRGAEGAWCSKERGGSWPGSAVMAHRTGLTAAATAAPALQACGAAALPPSRARK